MWWPLLLPVGLKEGCLNFNASKAINSSYNVYSPDFYGSLELGILFQNEFLIIPINFQKV